MRLTIGTLVLAALAGACAEEPSPHVVLADPSALDQSNAPADLALVADVRRALVTDAALGVRGKSVVVVVRDGVVTVRGEVPSVTEHDRIVARVVSVPGVVRTDDRITWKEQ